MVQQPCGKTPKRPQYLVEKSFPQQNGEKVENTFNNVTIRIEGSGDFIEDLEYHFGFDESKIRFFDTETENVIR